MRDSSIILIGTVLLLGWVLFRIIDPFLGGNVGTVIQLIGTLSGIAALGLLVIRSTQVIRRRTSSMKT